MTLQAFAAVILCTLAVTIIIAASILILSSMYSKHRK